MRKATKSIAEENITPREVSNTLLLYLNKFLIIILSNLLIFLHIKSTFSIIIFLPLIGDFSLIASLGMILNITLQEL